MSDKAKQLACNIRECARFYLDALGEHQDSANLHDTLMGLCESALLDEVIQLTNGNLTKASMILGISRGTLRKKLKNTPYD